MLLRRVLSSVGLGVTDTIKKAPAGRELRCACGGIPLGCGAETGQRAAVK